MICIQVQELHKNQILNNSIMCLRPLIAQMMESFKFNSCRVSSESKESTKRKRKPLKQKEQEKRQRIKRLRSRLFFRCSDDSYVFSSNSTNLKKNILIEQYQKQLLIGCLIQFLNTRSCVLFLIQYRMQKKKFQDMRRALDDKGYETIKSIGKGAFGEVVVARKKSSEKLYAVKIISKMLVKKKPFLQKYIDQQIEIMKKLEHPNIVKQQSSFETADFIIIVLQYCEQGNLLTYQSKLPGKTFSLQQATRVIVQMMKGLKCIHERNFIHRDIKSENVLISRIPTPEGYQNCYKIADFGFARSIGGSGAKTHCGTEKYMAPEIISNSYYGISVDIWALGVLFYFMLFAQYPFKGHDMKAEIQRRCTPAFNLSNIVTKKEKLKEITPDVEDFFKGIFVVDSKKRLTFSSILKHPLFKQYEQEFKENAVFYKKLQSNEQFIKDEDDHVDDYGGSGQMEMQDDTRADLLNKKGVSSSSKHLERELEQIWFEIQKTFYLKQCALELFDNYSPFLKYAERLAAKYYLIKAELFYSDPLLRSMSANKMPDSLKDANIDPKKWVQCTKTPEYRKYLAKLEEENMKAHIMFQDTYSEVNGILGDMPIKNFEKGYKPTVSERIFDQLKLPYRSTTSYIFKHIHENKSINSHIRNKIKMRLFCCHMINRIFNRKQVNENFPYFIKWLETKGINYSHTFDFIYFKKWIYSESQENLEKNISLLHQTFF